MNGSSSSLSGCFLRELYAGGILKYYLSLILRFGRYVEGGGGKRRCLEADRHDLLCFQFREYDAIGSVMLRASSSAFLFEAIYLVFSAPTNSSFPFPFRKAPPVMSN